jgi:hypothetical protein
MYGSLHRNLSLLANGSVVDADPVNEMPGKGVMHQELGLLALLDIRRSEIGRRDGVPIDLSQLGDARATILRSHHAAPSAMIDGSRSTCAMW